MTTHLVMQRIAVLYAFCSVLVPRSGVCQVPGPVDRQWRHHPDGLVGQISLHGYACYASVSKKPTYSALDAQTYVLGLNLVASPQITLETRWEAFKQDSVRHTLWGGLKHYLKYPMKESLRCNPDGRIGGIVLGLMAGARFSDSPAGATNAMGDISITVPVSTRLSLAAGYRYYEKIEVNDVVQGFSRLTLYFSEYPPDSVYVSPDGPVGYLVMSLSGGGSAKGVFGQISFIFPLDRKMSLKAVFTAERIKSPYQLSLAVGVGVSIYPQR